MAQNSYKTTDGGAIWQPIYFNSYGVFQFSIFNENIGWALIASNPFPELLRSTDGGVTWIGSYAAAFDYIRDFELILIRILDWDNQFLK